MLLVCYAFCYGTSFFCNKQRGPNCLVLAYTATPEIWNHVSQMYLCHLMPILYDSVFISWSNLIIVLNGVLLFARIYMQ